MTPLAQSNVADLVTEINAKNTSALAVFLPFYNNWKRNRPILLSCTPPIDPGPAPVGPPIGTVKEQLAGEIFDAFEAGMQARRNAGLDSDGKAVPIYEKDHEEPDYSSAITWKLYVPATDDSNPKLNTDPLPPGDEIPDWPNHFAVSPGDHAPAGKRVTGLDGRTYVKIGIPKPVGTSYVYMPVAA